MTRHSAAKFEQVGRALLEAATARDAIAGEEETYGNAIGLLAIHAAISYSDALCVAYGERKSTDGDHAQAATLLRATLGNRLPEKPAKALRKLVSAKDSIAYQGKYYPLAEGRELFAKANEFAEWATRMYQERPT